MYNSFEPALKQEELDHIFESQSVKYVFNPLEEFNNLDKGNKAALKHMVRAARALNDVFLIQDHSKNLEIKKALDVNANKGDTYAQKLLSLFNIFNGLQGNNGISKEPIRLFKGLKLAKGKNVFPEDLTSDELISYLKQNIEDIPSLLSFDTMVRREGNSFTGIPYSVFFQRSIQNCR